VQAEMLDTFAGSGKPDHKTKRELGWKSSSKSHKSSKSTDSPTLFPTVNPTMFPTMSPTYCGKASKSWWEAKWGRRLGSSWTKTSKSESCHSGSRSSKTWWSGHSRRMRSGDVGSEIGHNDGKVRSGDRDERRELKQNEAGEENAGIIKPDKVKVLRRRIDGAMRAQVDGAEP